MILFLRSLIFNICFFIHTFVFSTIAFIASVGGDYQAISKVGKVYATILNKLLKLITNIDVKIMGKDNIPKGGQYIIACKHQSAWETLVITLIFPNATIITKKELIYIPIFGNVVKRFGAICIDRSKGKDMIPYMINDGKKSIANNRPVFIFPEGTRTDVTKKAVYKYGIVALYDGLNVPVLPVALNSGYVWPKRSFFKKPGTIVVNILRTIEPGLDKDVFFTTIEQTIENNSKALAP